jgi:co-chaperonin GroES (HSP10)
MNVRPASNFVLVLMDPIQEDDGLIKLPHGNRVRTGLVKAAGPGRTDKRGRLMGLDVKAGDKVAFFREHLEHQQGKEIVRRLAELGDDWGLLREEDILFALTPEWKGTLS